MAEDQGRLTHAVLVVDDLGSSTDGSARAMDLVPEPMTAGRVAGERRRPAASSDDKTVMGPPRIRPQMSALPYQPATGRASASIRIASL